MPEVIYKLVARVWQKLDQGKLAETDDFLNYVELVEQPLKAILITNKYVD